jgi:hypothetical protein
MAANKEEVMKAKGSRRLVRWLGLALAVAALAAPSAQAVLAEGVSGSPYFTERTTQPRLYADDLHMSLSSELAGAPRGYAPINTRVPVRPDVPVVTSQAVSGSSSFDWGDASIGAGVIFTLVGFGAAVLATRQTRRSRLSAA